MSLQLFAVFVATHAGPNWGFSRQGSTSPHSGGLLPDGFDPNGQFPGGFKLSGAFPDSEEFQKKLTAKLCSNQTAAQIFLSKIQQLITTLQSNSSFAQVLADRANEVAYIQSSNSAARLSSDCPGFIAGLKSAKDADDAALKARFQYYHIAAAALMKTIGELVGGNPFEHRQ